MDKTLEKIINRILSVLIPDKIILFGSRAKGYARETSDYDLLIIKSGIFNKLAVEQEIYEKLVGIDESIDLLVRTPEYKFGVEFRYKTGCKRRHCYLWIIKTKL